MHGPWRIIRLSGHERTMNVLRFVQFSDRAYIGIDCKNYLYSILHIKNCMQRANEYKRACTVAYNWAGCGDATLSLGFRVHWKKEQSPQLHTSFKCISFYIGQTFTESCYKNCSIDESANRKRTLKTGYFFVLLSYANCSYLLKSNCCFHKKLAGCFIQVLQEKKNSIFHCFSYFKYRKINLLSHGILTTHKKDKKKKQKLTNNLANKEVMIEQQSRLS